MMRLREAAKALDVSISWLDKMVREGKIEVIWLGGVRRISEDEIDRIENEGVKINEKNTLL